MDVKGGTGTKLLLENAVQVAAASVDLQSIIISTFSMTAGLVLMMLLCSRNLPARNIFQV